VGGELPAVGNGGAKRGGAAARGDGELDNQALLTSHFSR
jgi:hypothetical protein